MVSSCIHMYKQYTQNTGVIYFQISLVFTNAKYQELACWFQHTICWFQQTVKVSFSSLLFTYLLTYFSRLYQELECWFQQIVRVGFSPLLLVSADCINQELTSWYQHTSCLSVGGFSREIVRVGFSRLYQVILQLSSPRLWCTSLLLTNNSRIYLSIII